MSLRLYMDVQVPGEITARLRGAGVDVLTAQEDDCDELPDEELLERAMSLGREMFTQDEDFLAEGTRRQREGAAFCGIFFAPQDTSRKGLYAKWLETYAKLENPGDVAGRVIFIP